MLNEPTLNTVIGDNNVLWFQASNKYIVINSFLNELITIFLASNSFDTFKKMMLKSHDFSNQEIFQFHNDIKSLLLECNKLKEVVDRKKYKLDTSFRKIKNHYKLGDVTIEINFSSGKLKSIIHPQLEHLEVNNPNGLSQFSFDIYYDEQQLYLYKNKAFIGNYPVNDYHLLQGKFAMELLCSINQNQETEWMGTFHASTIEKNNKSIMLIGDSGSGKSTFTAILMASGFNLVADDITPILAKDKKVYGYPAAVSIKSGAFKTLNSIIPEFKHLKEHYVNPFKGYVKYLPSQNDYTISKGFTCNTLVYVNYKNNSETNLESLELSEALKILIPESWLEPSEKNAEQFLNWLKKLKCYKLTYSNNSEAINKFSELF